MAKVFYILLCLVISILVVLGFRTIEPAVEGCGHKYAEINDSIFDSLTEIKTAAYYSNSAYEAESSDTNFGCLAGHECQRHKSQYGVTAVSAIDHENQVLYFAFKGTSNHEESSYFVNNIVSSGAGEENNKYYSSANLLFAQFQIDHKQYVNGYKLILTGHSQGGALATYSSLPYFDERNDENFKIYTFSPAVLPDLQSLKSSSHQMKSQNAKHYVHFMLEGDPIPKMNGLRNYLEHQGLMYVLPRSGVISTWFSDHALENVIEQLDEIKTEAQLCRYFSGYRELVKTDQ